MQESPTPPSMSVQQAQYLALLRQEPQFRDLLALIRPLLARPLPRYRPRELPSDQQANDWIFNSGLQTGLDLLMSALLETDWTPKPIQPKRKP